MQPARAPILVKDHPPLLQVIIQGDVDPKRLRKDSCKMFSQGNHDDESQKKEANLPRSNRRHGHHTHTPTHTCTTPTSYPPSLFHMPTITHTNILILCTLFLLFY